MACVEKWPNVTKVVPYQGLFFSGSIFFNSFIHELRDFFFFVVFAAPVLRDFSGFHQTQN